MVTPDQRAYTSKAVLLLCTADLPARALVSNMKAFNGKCGCSTCSYPGETVGTLHRIWPYEPASQVRTTKATYKALSDAIEKEDAVSYSINFCYRMIRLLKSIEFLFPG